MKSLDLLPEVQHLLNSTKVDNKNASWVKYLLFCRMFSMEETHYLLSVTVTWRSDSTQNSWHVRSLARLNWICLIVMITMGFVQVHPCKSLNGHPKPRKLFPSILDIISYFGLWSISVSARCSVLPSLSLPLLSSPLSRPQNTYRAHKIISKLKKTNNIISVSCFTNKSDLHWLSWTDSAVR